MLNQIILVIAYMGLTHVAVIYGNDRFALVALLLLLILFLQVPIRGGKRWPYALVTFGIVGVIMAPAAPWVRLVLFVPPIAINVGLAWLFGHTLLPGKTPLVERIIRKLHSADEMLDPSVWAYARQVTTVWTGLFCMNTLLCVGLAMVAAPDGILSLIGMKPPFTIPAAYWSLFSDLGCYLLTGVLFIAEYSYRKRRFPWQPYRNFFDFLRRAIAIGPAVMADLSREAAAEGER